MSEILQIFQHYSPPPYHQHQMPPPPPSQIHRDRVHIESQFNWSMDSDFLSPGIFDNFHCSELSGSPFMDSWSSSVDELSKVTAVAGHNRSLNKRKLEFDDVEVEVMSQKKRVEGGDASLIEPQPPNLNEKLNPKIDVKPDYVHVRARRGQATDTHSLAERARREKIKKKMQCLQDLVPGCNNFTSKAAILDEIIAYVQSLQIEIQLLNMKLEASTTIVNSMMDNSLPTQQLQ